MFCNIPHIETVLFSLNQFTADPNCYADFGFVVDVSGSVEHHWGRARSFIKQVVQPINISPTGGRAAIVQFSNRAELMINFSDQTSLTGFETALDGLDHWGATTRIDLGLETALNEMFQQSNGMRTDVPQNLVLITDGQQVGVNYESFRKRFNERRIRVVVILVGNARKDDIRHLVNVETDLYVAKNYEELVNNEFIKKITLCGGNFFEQLI